MNIEIQCCGLLMLLILLVILFREKTLDMSRRKKFVDTMYACVVCLAMDILSVIAIVEASKGTFPETVTLIICKIYLILLVNLGYRSFLYVAAEFFEGNTHRSIRNIYRAVFMVGVVAIAVLPIEYYCSGRVVYSLGPSPIATYILAFILFISTITTALIGGKGTSGRRKRVIIIWQVCWLCAAIIQFLMPEMLVVGFAAAFGLVLVYAELENPNEGIDRITGQFAYNELYSYVIDLYRRDIKFSAMHLGVDYSAGDYDLELELKAMRRIASFLEGSDHFVFRESDCDFTVIYSNEDQMEEDYERAATGLEETVDMPITVAYGLIPDSTIFENADEFMQFQHYHSRFIDSTNCMVARKDQAEDMRDYLKVRDQVGWGLANNSIEVVYQPIYNVKTKSFTSAEALVRLRDSEGKVMMPGRFIPIAEENGLIAPLGREVFRQVCVFLAGGEAQKLGIEYIEINISMAQFSEDEPAGFVEGMMDEYDVDPKWINLEITETADPNERKMILKNMDILRNRGVRFSLDDFGTGRSNFDYFLIMPIDMVKFDYKYTHWYFEGEKAREIVESIVGIIDRMDLPIVMEGIETEEQLDAMIKLGASYIQGYLFSKPVPEEEFLQFLRNHRTQE